MTTADTYCPLQFSNADFRHLKKAIRDHAPHLKLDLVHTDTGEPFVSVTTPRITLAGPMMASPSWEAAATIIRAERGWIVHHPEDGPLYEFATPQEVAVFLAG
jgi:hypothetical protein